MTKVWNLFWMYWQMILCWSNFKTELMLRNWKTFCCYNFEMMGAAETGAKFTICQIFTSKLTHSCLFPSICNPSPTLASWATGPRGPGAAAAWWSHRRTSGPECGRCLPSAASAPCPELGRLFSPTRSLCLCLRPWPRWGTWKVFLWPEADQGKYHRRLLYSFNCWSKQRFLITEKATTRAFS